MPRSIRFIRSCPSCSKPVQISIGLLGKHVSCHACGFVFQASPESPVSKPIDEFDLRVARLIQAADRQLEHYHSLGAER